MTCNNCGKPINRGKWCSDKCRMAYARTFGGEQAPVHNPNRNPNKPEHEHANPNEMSDFEPIPAKPEQTRTNDDWTNSAQTKTQAEIEAHYTLHNFPRNKYYSLNGGGSGALSPYPRTDPRAAAYIDK